MIYRKIILVGVLAASPILPAKAADVQIVAQNPVIELRVSEQVRSAPDTASFSTGVQSKAPTATQALRNNSAKTQILIDKIKALGIAEKDIQTTGINLNADYRYDRPSQENRFVGYRVSNQVQVIVRDISKLGTILDAMVSDGGATNLNGPNFTIDDDSEVKKLARARALANGKAQAMGYARAEGYSGVRILSISEGLRNVSQGPISVATRGIAAAESAEVPVVPGQVGTTISLNITYEMTR